MMTRNKSNRTALVKYFGLLPLAAVLLLAFSTNSNNLLPSGNELSNASFFSKPDPFDKAKVKKTFTAILVKLDQATGYEDRQAVYAAFEQQYQTLRKEYTEHTETIAEIAQRAIEKTKAPIFLKAKDTGMEPIFMESKTGAGYGMVEEMPRFAGCEDKQGEERRMCAQKAMLGHLYSNVKYPEIARDKNIQGTVVVRFLIDAQGKMLNPEVVRPIGGGCDEEVLRVLATMPDWVPGKHQGKAVKVVMNLPVKFKLEGGSEEKIAEKADFMPRFPGCEGEATEEAKHKCAVNKLITFLGENLEYPKDAKTAGIEGVVLTKFVVDKEGNIKKPHTVKSIGYGCDEAVLEVMDKMIKEIGPWTPGRMADGKKVSVMYSLPVAFRLQGKDKDAIANPVKSLTLGNFGAYPNPVSDQLTLRFDAKPEALKIELTNLAGQLLITRDLPHFDGHFEDQLRIDKSVTGTLLLTIRQGEKVFVQKIAVQR